MRLVATLVTVLLLSIPLGVGATSMRPDSGFTSPPGGSLIGAARLCGDHCGPDVALLAIQGGHGIAVDWWPSSHTNLLALIALHFGGSGDWRDRDDRVRPHSRKHHGDGDDDADDWRPILPVAIGWLGGGLGAWGSSHGPMGTVTDPIHAGLDTTLVVPQPETPLLIGGALLGLFLVVRRVRPKV
jgi:hypothetical protein